MIALSSNFLLAAFISYVVSTITFFVSAAGNRRKDRSPEDTRAIRWGWIGFWIAAIGFLFQTAFIFTRWYAGGHFPTSNMFEFMAFLAYSIIVAFLVIFLVYRVSVLGIFAMPIGVIMLAYASVFPREIAPLIPALKSYWLQIHVTVAALGEGAFAVGFAAGLMYLVRTVNQKENKRDAKWLEAVLCMMLMLIGFIIATTTFSSLGYQAQFKMTVDGAPSQVVYEMPAIAGPQNGELLTEGKMQPWFEAPGWMQGVNAARKLNTIIWSMASGLVLYGLIRLVFRKRLGEIFAPMVRDLDPDTIDEISYRAIAIGFPIFTLGALVFAMIWAAEAWGRFWGWDPKEVWALITWLFYSAYLHLRLSRGWQGRKSAWMSVIGFIVVMITLVFVNLVIVGLHSYA
nr:c-type cytochrome biogenesis protein CcsB [Ammoniphilus oxalaticus]